MTVDNSTTSGCRSSRIFLPFSTANGRTEICFEKTRKKWKICCILCKTGNPLIFLFSHFALWQKEFCVRVSLPHSKVNLLKKLRTLSRRFSVLFMVFLMFFACSFLFYEASRKRGLLQGTKSRLSSEALCAMPLWDDDDWVLKA